MKVLNFGSLNIDRVYKVDHIVRPGETISSCSMQQYAGGKGLNQSIALARAGVKVIHAGMIGEDGLFLRELLEKEKVDCSLLKTVKNHPTGTAFIQVAANGENSIVLAGGANKAIGKEYIAEVFSSMEKGDILIIQNEISCMEEIMASAAEKGMRIFFNPAPMTEEVAKLPLDLTDTLILNDTEYETLKNKISPFPEKCSLLLTHGAKGASYCPAGEKTFLSIPAAKVEKVVDTTAAGDTFTGYFIAGLLEKGDVKEALKYAARAAAICVSRPGAAPAIPYAGEVEKGE